MHTVKFAIPKGSIEDATFRILEEAWQTVSGRGRTYRVKLSDSEIDVKILRPQEIPVPQSFQFNDLTGLITEFAKNNKTLRISSEYLTTTASHIKSNFAYRKYFGGSDPMIITPWLRVGENKHVHIFLSFGATEAKPPEDVDAIFDITETGTTLAQNKLKIIDTVAESTAVLMANRKSLKDPAKREKIADMIALLRGVVEGRKKLHIFVNVRKEKLERLLKELPALKRPTISPLSEE